MTGERSPTQITNRTLIFSNTRSRSSTTYDINTTYIFNFHATTAKNTLQVTETGTKVMHKKVASAQQQICMLYVIWKCLRARRMCS